MAGPNFHETVMGHRFFGSQLPKLINAIERLAMAVEESNALHKAASSKENQDDAENDRA